MKREKHKHEFEIKAWADGWEILSKRDDGKEKGWFVNTYPDFDESGVHFLVNDAYVEFRKSEKEGKTIQIKDYRVKGDWIDVDMNTIPPSEKRDVDIVLRVKPELEPFTFEDDLLGMKVKHKFSNRKGIINYQDNKGVCIIDMFWSYKQLMKRFTDLSGNKLGKEL